MGREIKRVPLDFDFPVGKSYADANYEKHLETCAHAGEEDFDHDEETCGYVYWSESLPKGEGWQLWQTVSDGPTSPVFATAEELIDWMSQPVPEKDRPHYDSSPFPRNPWGQGWARPVAEKFVRSEGCIPSMVIQGGRVVDTAGMVAMMGSNEKGDAPKEPG